MLIHPKIYMRPRSNGKFRLPDTFLTKFRLFAEISEKVMEIIGTR